MGDGPWSETDYRLPITDCQRNAGSRSLHADHGQVLQARLFTDVQDIYHLPVRRLLGAFYKDGVFVAPPAKIAEGAVEAIPAHLDIVEGVFAVREDGDMHDAL